MGRRTLVLAIAVLLAAFSGLALYRYLTSVESGIRADISEVVVYRASADIPARTPGEDARASIVESRALREHVVFEGSTILCLGAAGENASKDPAQYGCLANPSDLLSVLNGHVAAGPIAKNQLIALSSFVDVSETEQILSESIAPGKVAISISVDADKSSGGFIRPGDHVNIIASTSVSPFDYLSIISNDELRNFFLTTPGLAAGGTAPDGTEEEAEGNGLLAAMPSSFDITQTIFQEIQVLAVGTNTRPAPEPIGLEPVVGATIVLEVTPQQAERIQYAATYSGLSLSLLPSSGTYVPYDAQPVVVDDIFGLLDRIAAELGLVLGG